MVVIIIIKKEKGKGKKKNNLNNKPSVVQFHLMHVDMVMDIVYVEYGIELLNY